MSFIITAAFLGLAAWWITSHEDYAMSFLPRGLTREVTTDRWSSPPPVSVDANHSYRAIIKTSAGDLTFNLLAAEAPQTVSNFIFLAKNNFYRNTFFHRVVKDFMIQGGDPTGAGTGSPGYFFADEPITRDYIRGTLAMANAGPNTNGSQFFIVHQDINLPKNYVIFGTLESGGNVLDEIASSPVTDNGSGEISRPLTKTYVNDIIITEE